jgi:hypothetical protein
MTAPLYDCNTEGVVALVGGAAKTVLGARAHANSGLQLTSLWVGFDGVTSTAVPALVELCAATFATNGPGTNSSSVTPRQRSGRPLTAGFTAAKNWTAEPTVLVVLKELLLLPNGGLVMYDFPLGTEPDTALNEGFALRLNAPAAVNVRASITVSRI